VLPVLALVMVGGALAVALSVELGRCGAAWREAAFAADAGAEAGAARLDPDAAYSGRIRLDPADAEVAAVGAALAARPRLSRRAEAEATLTRVCVTVTQPFPPGLLAPFVHGRRIAASACATPERG
jgi:expansin (peptidoglycan-binding protein)